MAKEPAKDALQVRLDQFFKTQDIEQAEAWMPTPGDYLIGDVIHMSMRTGGEYGDYLRVVYKMAAQGNRHDGSYTTADTNIAVHVFHQLLVERLTELNTKIGKRQIVQYVDYKSKRNPTQDEIDKGRDKYHLYYVENWDGDIPTVPAEEPEPGF